MAARHWSPSQLEPELEKLRAQAGRPPESVPAVPTPTSALGAGMIWGAVCLGSRTAGTPEVEPTPTPVPCGAFYKGGHPPSLPWGRGAVPKPSLEGGCSPWGTDAPVGEGPSLGPALPGTWGISCHHTTRIRTQSLDPWPSRSL